MPDPSLARRGLDRLLAHYPHADIDMIDGQSATPDTEGPGPMLKLGRTEGPWVCVDLVHGGQVARFAIWKSTGAVYRLDEHGAVEDDPFIEAGDELIDTAAEALKAGQEVVIESPTSEHRLRLDPFELEDLCDAED